MVPVASLVCYAIGRGGLVSERGGVEGRAKRREEGGQGEGKRGKEGRGGVERSGVLTDHV